MDKIRILWIDDCEGWEKNTCCPPSNLPEGIYQYFEIIRPDPTFPSSAPTTSVFLDSFASFFDLGSSHCKDFPAEIVAMDYNLSKYMIPSDSSIPSPESNPRRGRVANEGSISSKDTSASDTGNKDGSYGFEGLILGTFYAAMTFSHPAGVVPMTSYSVLADNPVVQTLHDLYQRIMGIDFDDFILKGEARLWENILQKGVQALRIRIESLYETGQIVLFPSDLMALAENAGHGVLTMRSPHAMRRLPVQGLFIDVPEEKRDGAIHKWARDLMRTVMVDCEELRQAQELAGMIWKTYTETKQVEDRLELSELAWSKENSKEYDNIRFKNLCEKFGADSNGKPSGQRFQNCVNIFSGEYSDTVRRWAALLVIRKLLKMLVTIRKKYSLCQDNIDEVSPGPFLTSADLFLALDPMPDTNMNKTEILFRRITKDSTVGKRFLRWNSGLFFAKDNGNLGLWPPDVFSGKSLVLTPDNCPAKNNKTCKNLCMKNFLFYCTEIECVFWNNKCTLSKDEVEAYIKTLPEKNPDRKKTQSGFKANCLYYLMSNSFPKVKAVCAWEFAADCPKECPGELAYGLRPSERQILQGFAISDEELGKNEEEREAAWRNFEPANRIIWGE